MEESMRMLEVESENAGIRQVNAGKEGKKKCTGILEVRQNAEKEQENSRNKVGEILKQFRRMLNVEQENAECRVGECWK